MQKPIMRTKMEVSKDRRGYSSARTLWEGQRRRGPRRGEARAPRGGGHWNYSAKAGAFNCGLSAAAPYRVWRIGLYMLDMARAYKRRFVAACLPPTRPPRPF